MEVVFQKNDRDTQNGNQRVSTRSPGGPLARPPPGARRVASWTPGATPGSPLWPIYPPSPEKSKKRGVSAVPPPPRGGNLCRRKDISGRKILLGRTSPGRGDHRHRHHHR